MTNEIIGVASAFGPLPKRHLPTLTNSSITAFRRCPREYFFSYMLLRKSRRVAFALIFGRMWHAGLEAWWVQECGALAFEAAIAEMRSFAAANEVDAFDLVKAECLMAGYTARWGDEPYETIAVEKRFAVPVVTSHVAPSFDRVSDPNDDRVGHDYDLCGSIDALVRKRDGIYSSLHNVESKTTSADISAGSDYWRQRIALDSQVSTYNAAAKAMGYDVQDTIYDVTRKPELIPLKATPEESKKYTKPTKAEPIPRLYANQRETDETIEEYRTRLTEDIIARPDWYFARQTIVRLEHDDAEHAKDIVHTAAMIQHAEDHDAWPRSPNACERFRRLCDFFEVCEGSTTIDDGTRFETKTSKHEELE